METLIPDIDFGDEGDSDDVLKDQGPDVLGAFRIVSQTNSFLVPQFRELIKHKRVINLRPEYQRRLRWNNKEKSRLIESLILNIPIPPIFLYESSAAHYEVMDGQQRLNAIVEFFGDEFELIGLDVLHELNGKKYNEFTTKIKISLDRSTVSAIVLLMDNEKGSKSKLKISDLRRFIFDRLNTGGRKLSAQEIRNAIAPKNLNNLIIDLSRFNLFTEVFKIPPYSKNNKKDYYEDPERRKNALYSSMRDCELVLRYFALRDEKNIKGSVKSILDRFVSVDTDISEEKSKILNKQYRERFEFLYNLFDGEPFRIKPLPNKILASLYDASMVALDQVWDRRSDIQNKKTKLLTRLSKATSDNEKYALIVGEKNTAQSIKDRISLMKEILLPN